MRAKYHFKFSAWVTLAWIFFWILGLPDYYQQYPPWFMLIFDFVLLFPIWFLGFCILNQVRAGKKIRISMWLGVYFSVPFLIYGLIYCRIYLQYGWSFLVRFWYLSVYYIIPWLLLLSTGIWLEKKAVHLLKESALYFPIIDAAWQIPE
ncbi:MAG: hypothetical protein ACFFB3_20860 [Candidatus Hodarchaeota archaeon]